MGEVWSAVHRVTGKAVAIKLLRCAPEEQAFGDARARFAFEARSACEVEHPNVVQVFDFIEREGASPFIVMELLEGETLASKLARAPVLSVAEATELLLPVVSAVGTAHERGIVHRDLKPSNIFLASGRGRRPWVKVLDFGIAKRVVGSAGERGLRTRTGSTLGTPCYMAPEQATGERSIDHRVDIWSLGVLLYEVLSGVRPLEGENAAQLVMRLLSTGIMPLEVLVPDLPGELSRLVGRMLSRDVGRRPADLREVFSVLRGLTDTESLEFGAPNTHPCEPSATLSAFEFGAEEAPVRGRLPRRRTTGAVLASAGAVALAVLLFAPGSLPSRPPLENTASTPMQSAKGRELPVLPLPLDGVSTTRAALDPQLGGAPREQRAEPSNSKRPSSRRAASKARASAARPAPTSPARSIPALASTGEEAPASARLGSRGQECDRSAECASHLCVAFTCR
jgi:serine/threonine protein kinase